MTRPDDHIRRLVTVLRAARAEAEAAVDRFRLLQPGRRLRVPDVGPTWSEWLESPDGVAYAVACRHFEKIADLLIDVRPETLVGLALKLEALSLADLCEEDNDRLAEERRAIIAEGGAS